MKAIILAGGGGTRLWPASRKNSPKQARPLIDEDTLLQKTFKRICKKFKVADIIISCGERHYNLIRKQIPKVPKTQYILEPAKKDTAAAIGLVATHLHHKNPEEKIVIIYADHYVGEEAKYIQTLDMVEQVLSANPNQTITVGLKPKSPATGYGYIQRGKIFSKNVYKVQRFVEKPNLATAKKYVQDGGYFWNLGMFAWQVDYLLGLYKRHLPKMHKILMAIEKSIGKKGELKVLKREFGKIEPISIDYGVLEKTKDILLIQANFQWSDIGDWQAIKELLLKNKNQNLTRGNVLTIDSKNCLLYGYGTKLLATVGLEDMVVVETEDAILVCPAGRAQEVKKVVKKLEKGGGEKFL
ncbi:mannose-1-phosphate guanylyltransferase [Patescibacteria group bacterium]|nr:mannose-1-phosphate guanylyltransferase [Patescibacteria group bacterium]MBU4511929.1 mannose-1-phosphate guanylyltransferase [Patescibacteria group bacterium]MCG2692897.1 mannose-1-phosphate guanylyltransferase [Candidatus Parcubacteria bacterium]